MDDLFKELSPAEAQMAVLQFMGQHLTGDLKELDRNMISRTNSLQGMTLQPEAILRTVAPTIGMPQAQPQPAPLTPASLPNIAVSHSIQPVQQEATQQVSITVDKDQLELDLFNTSPKIEKVLAKLECIEDRLSRLNEKHEQLLSLIEKINIPTSIDSQVTGGDFKKKD